MQNWIIDYANPVTYTPADVPSSTAFLNQLLVVYKDTTPDTEITTVTVAPTESELLAVKRAFDGGMSKVSYIKQEDLTGLSGLSLKGNFYTIICIGFDATDRSGANYGDYDGVVIHCTNSVSDVVTGIRNQAFCYGSEGLKACFTFGKLLSGSEFRNLAYTDSTNQEETLINKGLAQSWYDAKGIAWGYDDQVGSRLVTAFINGKGLSTPYIKALLLIQLQTSAFNIMSNVLNYTPVDAKAVEGYNKSIIENYIRAGLLISANYQVSLSPTDTNEFDSVLSDVETPLPIFKISIVFVGG